MAASRGYMDLPTARQFGLHIRPAGTVIFPKRGGAIATNKKRILREPAAYDLNTMDWFQERILTHVSSTCGSVLST